MNYQNYKGLKTTLADILAKDARLADLEVPMPKTDTRVLEGMISQAKNSLYYGYQVYKPVEEFFEEAGYIDDDLCTLMEVAKNQSRKPPQQQNKQKAT